MSTGGQGQPLVFGMVFAFVLAVAAALPCDRPAASAPWRFAGPHGGYVDASDALEIASIGAAQALVPVDGGHLLAFANGGIFRMKNMDSRKRDEMALRRRKRRSGIACQTNVDQTCNQKNKVS